MGLRYNPFNGSFDFTRSPGSYLDGEVATFADLPLDTAAAPLNSAWLVREASGLWFLTRKPAGIYIRTATGGTDRNADYTYASAFPDVFSDANFTLYDDADSTKNAKFQLSGLTTGTTRTLTVPDKSGTLATTDAGDMASGTLADARLSSNVPLKDAANTYTQNQTLNGTNNVAPNQTGASGSSLITRDLGDARHPQKMTVTTTGVSNFYLADLLNSGTTTSAGQAGWEGGVISFQAASSTERLAFWRGATGAVANQKARLVLRGTNALNQGIFWSANFAGTLTMRFRLNQTTACQLTVGLSSPAAAGSGTIIDKIGAYLRYDAATDTNFMFQNGATAANAVSSGVAVDTNWHVVRIRFVSTTSVFYSLDGGAETQVTVSTGSGSVSPAFFLMTTANTDKTADFSAVTVEATT
jgi:hypothetical protein